MGPVAYELCQKPVIGLAMWLASLCVFPPLFSQAPIALSTSGSKASTVFSVPVGKTYVFELHARFGSARQRIDDDIIGNRHTPHCEQGTVPGSLSEEERKGLGRPIPFRVIVRRASDLAVVMDKVFTSLCSVSYSPSTHEKTRRIGAVQLPIGNYEAEVVNLVAQDGFGQIATTVSLSPGRFLK